MRKAVFFLLTVILLSACDKKDQMVKLAEMNLRQSVDYPKQLKILAVSEPDSAFGTHYFSRDEIKGMMTVMQKVTADIMARTGNMTKFDPNDHYVMDMAERQMQAMSEIRAMVRQGGNKGEWSGWKIKIDFQARSKDGIDYRAERWFFLNKEGNTIFRTFELPLPYKDK